MWPKLFILSILVCGIFLQGISIKLLPFSTPLPKFQSKAKLVSYPREGMKECNGAMHYALKYMSQGMPYPDAWTVHIVCNDSDWEKLLKDSNLDCEGNPSHCTVTAFTITAPDPNDPCTNDCATDKGPHEAGHTYIRGLGFITTLHDGGARHTMLHELGHILAGRREENAEAWANEWEHEYGEK